MTFARLIVVRRFSSSSTERKLWRVIFYGSDSFSLKSLQTFERKQVCYPICRTVQGTATLKKTDIPQVVDSIKVVCPKLKGLVADYALKKDLPVSEWPYAVPNNTFDVGVVVSFGHLIPASSIHACKYGMINVHPSLLPRWRGAAPLVHTLLAGDTKSGISVITVAPNRFDTGKIVMQRTVAVPQGNPPCRVHQHDGQTWCQPAVAVPSRPSSVTVYSSGSRLRGSDQSLQDFTINGCCALGSAHSRVHRQIVQGCWKLYDTDHLLAWLPS
ncbi:hypothetical protein MRX96_038343 [Rhipicephalus microplus]